VSVALFCVFLIIFGFPLAFGGRLSRWLLANVVEPSITA
jgi:hypothetical protein